MSNVCTARAVDRLSVESAHEQNRTVADALDARDGYSNAASLGECQQASLHRCIVPCVVPGGKLGHPQPVVIFNDVLRAGAAHGSTWHQQRLEGCDGRWQGVPPSVSLQLARGFVEILQVDDAIVVAHRRWRRGASTERKRPRAVLRRSVGTLWLVDADLKQVEVSTPDAAFPRVESARVTWTPPGTDATLVIELPTLFM